MDLIVPIMALFVPLETAGRWFCAAVLLSTTPAVSALSFALHKKLSLWPIFTLLFAYNAIFAFGFLNYLLGLNLALGGTALWILLREKPARLTAPVFALVSIAIYFTHLYALGVYGLLLFGYELSTYRERRRGGSPADRETWAVGLSQFLLPAALFVAFSPTFRLNIGLAGTYVPWHKVQGVFGIFNNGHTAADMLSAIVVGTLLLAGAVLGKLTLHKHAVTPCLLLLICFLITPEVLFGSGYASYRLPIAIAFFLVAALDWRVMPKIASFSLVAVVAVLFVVRVSMTTQDWRASGHDLSQLRKAFESLPEKSRILHFVVNEGSQDFLIKPPLQHLATLAVIQRSAFVPTLFADPGKQPVVIRDKYQGLAQGVVRDIVPKKLFLKTLEDSDNPLHEKHLAGFDYTLLFAMKPLSFVIPSSFSSITRSKPTAFQAVSFKQFWMRMGGWKNIGEERIRSTTSNITSYGSRSTATRCYGAGWQSGCGI